MKNSDCGTSLFWLVLSIIVCITSLRLGIGKLGNPGMGFLPFCAAAMLGILSLALFLKACIAKGTAEGPTLFTGKTWRRVPLILIALAVYIALLPFVGYLVGTFLFMGLVFRVAGFQKWRWVFVSSFLTTAVTYFVFSTWLGCRFPLGILGA